MTTRTVEVILRMRTEQYAAEADRMAAKTERLDRSVNETDRDLKKLPPDAAKAAAALKLLGDDAGRSALKLDDLGKSSTSMGLLDQRILHTRGELKRLAEEFDRTGHAGTLQQLFKSGDELKDLERLKKRLVSWAGEAGQQAGPGFLKSFTATFEGAGQYVIPGLIAAGIAISPLIGAAINAALLSGVGLGGVALGIAGQIHDPRVHEALASLGNDLLTTLRTATLPFQGPLIAAIATIQQALHGAIASTDFAGLAATLVPLANGLAGLIGQAGPGLSKALHEAIPLLMVLSQELPHIGLALSKMFELMAKGGTGAQEGLRALVDLIGGALVTFGALVLVLSKVFESFVQLGDEVFAFASVVAHALAPILPALNLLAQFADAVGAVYHEIRAGTGDVEQLGRSLKGTGDVAVGTATSFDVLASQISQTAVTSSTLAAAMSQKLFNSLMSVDQATLSWHQSLTQLHDTLAQNGTAIDKHSGQLDLNSKKGQENEQAILGVVTANMQQYQAFIAAGGSAKDAAAQYDINTQALIKQMRQAGYTQAQIDGLIGKYEGIPDIVNTELQFKGLTDAILKLDELMRRINGLPYSREVRINVTTTAFAPNIPAYTSNPGAGGARGGRASGGPVTAGQPYWVGERGIPELFVPQASGTIVPMAQVPRAVDYGALRSGAAMGGGGQTVIVNVPVTVNAGMGTDGYQVGRQVAAALRPFVERVGGSVQQAVMRRAA